MSSDGGSRRVSRLVRPGFSLGALALVLVVLAGCTPAPQAHACVDAGDDDRSSIVFVLTDDQRWDTLWAMPGVERTLTDRGVDFANGFVVNPHCCPSRASILTGQFSHSTGVYTNEDEYHGGFAHFDDGSTVATWLQEAGYTTALMGKYLNGYGKGDSDYVPPGWDRWLAFATNAGGGGKYYDYKLSDDGDEVAYGDGPEDHSTEVLATEAVDFICRTTGPFFLLYAPYAPHGFAIPAPEDAGTHEGLELDIPPSYDEADVSDKPRWVRDLPLLGPYNSHPNYFEALAGVDRAVEDIVGALEDSDRLENTLIVFASDNGYLWGEHRYDFKLAPYEESIRVPFVMRFDRVTRSARVDKHLVLNVDLAPTFADVAGVSAPGAEGTSLLPLLRGQNGPWRDQFLIEHLNAASVGAKDPVPTYCALRTRTELYVAYETGEEELYDLRDDPYQLRNRSSDPAMRERVEELRRDLRRACQPSPPGYRLP